MTKTQLILYSRALRSQYAPEITKRRLCRESMEYADWILIAILVWTAALLR